MALARTPERGWCSGTSEGPPWPSVVRGMAAVTALPPQEALIHAEGSRTVSSPIPTLGPSPEGETGSGKWGEQPGKQREQQVGKVRKREDAEVWGRRMKTTLWNWPDFLSIVTSHLVLQAAVTLLRSTAWGRLPGAVRPDPHEQSLRCRPGPGSRWPSRFTPQHHRCLRPT